MRLAPGSCLAAALAFAAFVVAPSEAVLDPGDGGEPPSDCGLVGMGSRACRPQQQEFGMVWLGDPWTPENRQKLFGSPPNPSVDAFHEIIYETPLLLPLSAAFWLPERVDPAAAEAIAQGCKEMFPEWWNRIGCASVAVRRQLVGVKFDGLRTFCKAHAEAFRVVFDHLGVPHSSVRYLAANGSQFAHVVNAVAITDPQGTIYEYAIDNGNYTGILFPLSESAIHLHDPSGMGRSDNLLLPEISENPQYSYQGPQILGAP